MDQSSLLILIVMAAIVFGVLYFLARQVNRIFPIGCFIPLLVAGGGVVLFLLGISLC